MKRVTCLLAGTALLAAAVNSAQAQASYGSEAYAQRQQEEERWRRLSAQMEELVGTQEVLRKRIQSLEEENRTLRSEVNKQPDAGVSPEEFNRVVKQITEKLKEIDEKRVSDNKALLEQVKQLVQNIKPVASPTPSPRSTDPTPARQEGYTHVMQEGETISAVVQAFRAQGVRVSVDQVLKANPKLDPRRLSVGTEIFIPKPD